MGTWLEHVVVALGWQNKGTEYKETSFAWVKNIRSRAPWAATRRRCLRCRRLAGVLFQAAHLAAELLGWGVLLASSLQAPQILGSGTRCQKHFVEAGPIKPLP